MRMAIIQRTRCTMRDVLWTSQPQTGRRARAQYVFRQAIHTAFKLSQINNDVMNQLFVLLTKIFDLKRSNLS